MKLSALTFFVIGIVFGLIAVIFGVIKEYSVVTPGVLNQFVHADASIYACGLISAACFVTSGLVLIHRPDRVVDRVTDRMSRPDR
jgi:hypothetical protein